MEVDGWVRRACLVVEAPGTDEEAEEVVSKLASSMGARYAHIEWGWSDEPPGWMGVGAQDQLTAYRRDAGPDAVFLIVEVWEVGKDFIEWFTNDDE